MTARPWSKIWLDTGLSVFGSRFHRPVCLSEMHTTFVTQQSSFQKSSQVGVPVIRSCPSLGLGDPLLIVTGRASPQDRYPLSRRKAAALLAVGVSASDCSFAQVSKDSTEPSWLTGSHRPTRVISEVGGEGPKVGSSEATSDMGRLRHDACGR